MSTLRPRLLAYVEARHDYFADGRCRAMRFDPAPACREWLSSFELLVRSDENSLSVHVPEHRLQELREEARAARTPPTLDFTVSSRDPAFAYYTEDAAPQALGIALGDASDESAWLAGLGRRWTLQWHSRRSIWRYWLLGDWEEPVLTIVDTRGSREFDALGLTLIDASQSLLAHCFRSRTPLALSDRAPTGLQLRAGLSAAATRVAISQLPAPRPTALQYESGPNGRRAVSEIFVSR
jgi:hypothetical protein